MDPAFYLDNAATTRILPEVLDEALPLLGERFGNPYPCADALRRPRAASGEAWGNLAGGR